MVGIHGAPEDGIQVSTGDVLKIKETAPPKNVRIGLFFREHEVYSAADVPRIKNQLTQRFTEFFSPGENNILLKESAADDDISATFEKAEIEGYARFGSFRKAFIYTAYTVKGIPIPDNLDSVLDNYDKELLERPQQSPKWAYRYLVATVLDELTEQGYAINVVHEKGVSNLLSPDADKKTTYRQDKDLVTQVSKQTVKRDEQAVQQITQLVNDAEKETGNTNIVAAFGTIHQLLVDALPDRIKAVTTTYADPIAHPSQESFYRIHTLLSRGEKVPETFWMRHHYAPKIRGIVHKATSYIPRKQGN